VLEAAVPLFSKVQPLGPHTAVDGDDLHAMRRP
jgi:hypothetical protein